MHRGRRPQPADADGRLALLPPDPPADQAAVPGAGVGWSTGGCWRCRARCSSTRSATAASPASSRSTASQRRRRPGRSTSRCARSPSGDAPVFGPARRPRRPPPRAAAVPGADRGRVALLAAAGRRPALVSALVFGIGFGVGLPVFVGLPDAPRRLRRAAAPPSAASWRRSTPASAPARSSSAGSSSTTATGRPTPPPPCWPPRRCRTSSLSNRWCCRPIPRRTPERRRLLLGVRAA